MYSAVKRLIAINRIQNKSFCLPNIYECTVYMYYVYINTHTCMYIFKKKVLCLYNKNIYIIYKLFKYKYIYVNIFKIYTVCVCIYIYIINIHSTHPYIM